IVCYVARADCAQANAHRRPRRRASRRGQGPPILGRPGVALLRADPGPSRHPHSVPRPTTERWIHALARDTRPKTGSDPASAVEPIEAPREGVNRCAERTIRSLVAIREQPPVADAQCALLVAS